MCIFICFVKFFSYNDKLQICRSPVFKSRDRKGGSKFFKVFFKFNCITSINLIVTNKQCLQCVFYSLLSLQKHRVVEKGIKTISRSKNLYAPTYKIPGSATGWGAYGDLQIYSYIIGWRHGVRLSKARHTSTDSFLLKFQSSNVKH